MSNNGKTSYVSGSNSFLAYNQDGLLNGVDYAANLVIVDRYYTNVVVFENKHGDLLLKNLFVTAMNEDIEGYIVLRLYSNHNGGAIMQPLLSLNNVESDELYLESRFYRREFNQPVLLGEKLIVDCENLTILRTLMVFRPLVYQRL